LAHPECTEAVLRLADYVVNDRDLNYAKTAPGELLSRLKAHLHQMEMACPDKTFISAPGEVDALAVNVAHETQHDGETLSLYEDRKPEIIWTNNWPARLAAILRMLEMS